MSQRMILGLILIVAAILVGWQATVEYYMFMMQIIAKYPLEYTIAIVLALSGYFLIRSDIYK